MKLWAFGRFMLLLFVWFHFDWRHHVYFVSYIIRHWQAFSILLFINQCRKSFTVNTRPRASTVQDVDVSKYNATRKMSVCFSEQYLSNYHWNNETNKSYKGKPWSEYTTHVTTLKTVHFCSFFVVYVQRNLCLLPLKERFQMS